MADKFTNGRVFTQVGRTLESKLSNQVGKGLSSIRNPILRSGLGSIVNNFLPGFGGGVPDFSDNGYRDLVNNRLSNIALQTSTTIASQNTISNAGTSEKLSKGYDWRARLRPKAGGVEQFYGAVAGGDALMRPLKESGGLVWQYTPNIFLSGTAEYNQTLLQGMNYPINTFVSSRPPDIPVAADFTANDIYEARYLLAVMTFLKVCTKSYYGDSAVASGDYGTPPPVLLFEYLGDHGFNKVPVVVTNYSIQLSDDVDYIPVLVETQGTTVTHVPTKTNIVITLTPNYTPHKLRRRFDVNAVRSGKAYRDGFI
jgi:hypothetical protein